MKNRYLIYVGLVLALFLGSTSASAMETSAQYAILTDAATGQVLWTKNAQEKMAPASMSKLMTLYIVFDRLKNKSIHLTDKVFMSQNAWKKGGAMSGSSTMFADPGSTITVEEAIRAIIVFSANDACIAMAEFISGSEKNFAELMNQQAGALHLTSAHFTNATGWPDPNEKISAQDLATLTRYLVTDFPDFYPYFKEKAFTWNHITQPNRNTLLAKDPTVDGLKTGHTQTSRYGMVVSAMRDGKRRILIVNGIPSQEERTEESKRLLNWGFRAFSPYTLVTEGQVLGKLKVVNGAQKEVELTTLEPVTRLLPFQGAAKMTLVMDSPSVKAPVKKGQPVGRLLIKANYEGGVDEYVPVIASQDIRKQSILEMLLNRMKSSAVHQFSAFAHILSS